MGQSSPGNLHFGQVPSNWTRQIPQTSSSGMSQRHAATACHETILTFMSTSFCRFWSEDEVWWNQMLASVLVVVDVSKTQHLEPRWHVHALSVWRVWRSWSLDPDTLRGEARKSKLFQAKTRDVRRACLERVGLMTPLMQKAVPMWWCAAS